MNEEVDIVVIGSGALGSSAAYHLSAAGQRVVLVDQHALGSQTSPRAAGLSAEVRGSPLMTRLAVRGVEKLLGFSAETGEPLDIHQPGSLKLARRPEHAAQIEAEIAHGREQGIPIRLVTTAEACRLMPFLEPQGIEAVSYNPRDVYLDPGQLPVGYARAASRLGCALVTKTRVEEITIAGGAVRGVRTSRGTIRAPVVVDAAGAWLPLVVGSANLRLPLVATRHQLLITRPIVGVMPEQAITRIIDANVYVRPCNGGLMLGGYEPDPLQVALEEMPPDYSISDMPLDLSVLRRLADRVVDQFPIFRDAEVAILRGGLPTITPDDEHVIGPLPGVAGLFVVGGCNVGGLSIAPAFGELLAAMILGGDVPADVGPLLPQRLFERDYPEAELRAICREQYAFHYWSEASRLALRPAARGDGATASSAGTGRTGR